MIFSVIFVLAALFGASSLIHSGERITLSPDTPKSEIIHMKPSEVDPSLLPLDPVENLNTTGVPPKIDLETWRLTMSGERVRNPLSLTYDDLVAMPQVKKRVILICPGVFVDYAEWEGVPLKELMDAAKVRGDYKKVTFRTVDGYRSSFSKEEVKNNLLFLALKVNGEVLPKEHGFPVRLVAEDILGGSWVKWVSVIEVN